MIGLAAQEALRGRRPPSRIASRILGEILATPPEWRTEFYTNLSHRDFRELCRVAERETGSPFGLWRDDPVGFDAVVLGGSLYSAQKDILTALTQPGVRQVIVPAAFSTGKTATAAKATLWAGCVWPTGYAKIPTIATRYRQVQRQLWPEIRALHARAQLPGTCGVTQWKAPNRDGVDTDIAYGFAAPGWDEAALQGIHGAYVLLIVDEAGGIGPILGRSTRNLLTGDARMLAIGNPATDSEGTWFEGRAQAGYDPDQPDTVTIPLPATRSPAFSGERVVCRACPPEIPTHLINRHLVGKAWVSEAVAEHGEDAPYIIAKVHARFPRGGASRAIPAEYVDAAIEAMNLGAWWGLEHVVSGWPSTDPKGEAFDVQPAMYSVVDLGVDVAADGGDELVIARREGDIARVLHVQSGAGLHNSVDVAGIIRPHILAANQLRAALESPRPVKVKIDAIGVGWGVASTLEAWASEGLLGDAEVVRVVASENPDRPDNKTGMWRPKNKRAEMWLAGREAFKPDPSGRTAVRLDVDTRTAAQLRAPLYGTESDGRTAIEKKDHTRARLGGANTPGKSPDRADAVLLAVYDPQGPRRVRIW